MVKVVRATNVFLLQSIKTKMDFLRRSIAMTTTLLSIPVSVKFAKTAKTMTVMVKRMKMIVLRLTVSLEPPENATAPRMRQLPQEDVVAKVVEPVLAKGNGASARVRSYHPASDVMEKTMTVMEKLTKMTKEKL